MQMRWLGGFYSSDSCSFPSACCDRGSRRFGPAESPESSPSEVCFCPRFSERFHLKVSPVVGVPRKHLNEESRGSGMNFFSSWPELMKLRPHGWTWQLSCESFCNTQRNVEPDGDTISLASQVFLLHYTHFFFLLLLLSNITHLIKKTKHDNSTTS